MVLGSGVDKGSVPLDGQRPTLQVFREDWVMHVGSTAQKNALQKDWTLFLVHTVTHAAAGL